MYLGLTLAKIAQFPVVSTSTYTPESTVVYNMDIFWLTYTIVRLTIEEGIMYYFRGTEMYPSDGATSGSPQTPVTVKEHAPGTMYADPKRIEHETAATGDQYTLLTSDTKAKKNDQVSAHLNYRGNKGEDIVIKNIA